MCSTQGQKKDYIKDAISRAQLLFVGTDEEEQNFTSLPLSAFP